MCIREMLQMYRKKNNLSYRKMAKMLNVSPNLVWKWENEERLPNFDSVIKISEILKIDLREIVIAYMTEKTKRRA